jgi:hypothetical protein
MKISVLATVALASLFLCAAQDKRKLKPAELELLEMRAVRTETRMQLEGKVRNIGEQPVPRVRLLFEFLSSDKKVIGTKQADMDSPVLEPGEDDSFLLETAPMARVVYVRVEAQDSRTRRLNVQKNGPYPIE